MKQRLNLKVKMWFTVCALFMLMSLASVGYAQTVDLTAEEIDCLTYLREEEKLARDVYIFLYDKWQSRIFKNISVSEQMHMDAIKTLLQTYEIPDPAEGNEEGVFTNADLQALYYKLVRDGSVSLVEALKVGVLIEEMDILDLKEGIVSNERKDIITVYSNLLLGSLNHLESFESKLDRR